MRVLNVTNGRGLFRLGLLALLVVLALGPATPVGPVSGQATSADLSIAKADVLNTVAVGDQINYTVTVTNNGPDLAQGVVVTDTLPGSVTFVAANTVGGTCGESGGIITCNLDDMANAAVTAIAIDVTTTAVGQVTNNVSVTASTADPNTGNNAANDVTNVVAQPTPKADLGMTQSDAVDPVNLGDNVTYNLTVTNNGPDSATGVVVTDTLPTGSDYVSGTADQGSCFDGGTSAFCSLGTMANGASVNIALVLTTTVAGTISNHAIVVSSVEDPGPNSHSVTENTTVLAPPPNNPPTADPQTASTYLDNSVGITLTGSDVETASGDLTFSVTGPPTNGSLSGVEPNLTFTPTLGFTGADSFTFSVTDRGSPDNCAPGPSCNGALTSADAAVSITVVDGVDFTVTLEGRPAPPDASWSLSFLVDFYSPGVDRNSTPPLFSFTPTTDQNGQFNLSPTPGIYDVRAKGNNTLATELLSLDLTSPPAGLVDLGLQVAGDYDGNNAADAGDYSRLLVVFGNVVGALTGLDPNLDFNGDGVVDAIDYAVVIQNYNSTGAPPP